MKRFAMAKRCSGCVTLWLTSITGLSLPLLWMDMVNRGPGNLIKTVSATQTSRLDTCMIPSHSALVTYTLPRLATLYHTYLSSEQIPCKQGVRLGRTRSGGWDVCIDEEFRLADPCVVYSFGVGKDFSFSEEMTRTFGCFVYAFDPGVKRTGRRQLQRLIFTPEGINNFTGYSRQRRTRMSTLKEIRRHFGHCDKTVDVITMDIAPTELAVIPHALQHGDLHSVKQFNLRLGNPAHVLKETTENYISRLNVLRDLCFVGFRSWIINENNKCLFHSDVLHKHVIGCHEVSFLNLRYI
ncbi:methyltransferase-like protein 24 isoform X1 [Mizuhopecten yessoensis]|uniref:methyltransferase-like protein 24 isoform X1 n=1 Tax=Mizuhopecten yessoensis TaxID=6573 RepID=UPI000B4593AF|nr:methyltransferase-like protein 24 isoform X1 [Mizuhopecten yessoensis]